jgi:hypothetical protein
VANVINRITFEFRESVNTPDFDPADWIINPDLSAVAGLSRHYWKVVGDTVQPMTAAERRAADRTLARLSPQRFEDDFIGELGARWTKSVQGALSDATLVSPGGEGGIVRLVANPANGDFAQIATTQCQFTVQDGLAVRFVFRKVTDTNQRCAFGLTFNVNNQARFRSVNGNNWFGDCVVGGVLTAVNLNYPSDLDWHVFTLRATPTELRFVIDNIDYGQIALVNVPNVPLEIFAGIEALTGAATIREAHLDRVDLRSRRP